MKATKTLAILGFLSLIFLIACTKDDNKPKPTASFTASKTSVVVGESIQFTNTSENATTYAWSFGDGTTSVEASPSKSYSATGTYTVTLAATGAGGVNSATQEIIVVAASLYFIDPSDELIQKLTLDNTLAITTVKDVAGMSGVGLAYDKASNKIFWSDYTDATTPNGKIWKMNLDGTGEEAIASGILDPYGIALNPSEGKIYWADDNGYISKSNLDGTATQTGVVIISGGGMRAVAIDTVHSKMYFYEVNNDNLYIADLDGNNRNVLLTGSYGYGLFVDNVNNKLYFNDYYGPSLKRCNLDGSSVEDIDATDTRIYGIAIDYRLNKLYWSARDAGEIYMSDLDGTNKITLATGLSSPRGIFLKN